MSIIEEEEEDIYFNPKPGKLYTIEIDPEDKIIPAIRLKNSIYGELYSDNLDEYELDPKEEMVYNFKVTNADGIPRHWIVNKHVCEEIVHQLKTGYKKLQVKVMCDIEGVNK